MLLEPLAVRAGGRDLRGRPRRPRAGPHPGPPRPRAAPRRLPRRPARRRARSRSLADAVARVHVHHAPVLPELVLGEVPPGTHVLVMTHDHAEDAALCDAALRCAHLGSIGLIGSSAKWARFRARPRRRGPRRRGRSPGSPRRSGCPDLTGKEPATIAVSVAADLLRTFEPAERHAGRCRRGGAAGDALPRHRPRHPRRPVRRRGPARRGRRRPARRGTA